jgi:arylsulfatase
VFIPAGETPANPYHPDEPFHTTDFFTDVALEYLEQARSTPDEPFLLHLCYNAPHFPLEAPDDLVAKYRGRYRKGWDVLKREKLTRLKEMGLVHPEQQLPRATGFDLIKREPHDFHAAVDNGDLPDWETLSASDRRELDFRRALYAAQVEHLDRNLGRVVLALKAQGRFENTLIVFMSDNGCSGEVGPFGCNWGVNHEENFPEWKREGGWASSQGQCWASLSNAPFRKFKIFVHEGGIASPFIAHWPEGIADPGRIQTDQVFHLIDLMPTLCEVAGARYPSATSRGSITPLEGESMAGYFSDPHLSAEPRTLFWQHELNAAVRQGNWKLVTSNDRQDDAWELYDLSTDRSESRNLIERESGLADQLKTEWRSWSERVGVIPRPEDRDPFRPLPIGDPA